MSKGSQINVNFANLWSGRGIIGLTLIITAFSASWRWTSDLFSHWARASLSLPDFNTSVVSNPRPLLSSQSTSIAHTAERFSCASCSKAKYASYRNSRPSSLPNTRAFHSSLRDDCHMQKNSITLALSRVLRSCYHRPGKQLPHAIIVDKRGGRISVPVIRVLYCPTTKTERA